MAKNHAVIIQKAGEAVVQETSIPKLRDDYIIVKTKAVALNPTDVSSEILCPIFPAP
jgi:NADPH:quinone reductase-like Zn-dependent oxidoreductase